MQEIKLLRAGPEDIPEITALATVTWNQHYPAIISREQIDYMLGMMYSSASLQEQMEKKHQFYFISNGRKNIGFVSVSKEAGKDWFLHKFYIDQDHAAKGAGSAALELLVKEIHPDKITLTVNRQNIKSINFYFKNGFRIKSVADFDIGQGYVMNDFVMEWKRGISGKGI